MPAAQRHRDLTQRVARRGNRIGGAYRGFRTGATRAVEQPLAAAIGSGGNINKIFSLSKRKEGKPLSLDLLRDYYKEFSNLSVTQRISLYKLREDRADVIVPALLIYINVMRWADTEEIFVPKIGLADGLIYTLYDEVKQYYEPL